MKINSIRISNILSFEYKDNIDDCQELSFYGNLNILIGPNGAGKSNFLEILNQIFKKILYKQASLNESTIQQNKINPSQYSLSNTVTFSSTQYNYLNPNYYSNSIIKTIKLKIGINESDKSNLKFIYKNVEAINALLTKYSNSGVTFPKNFDFKEIITTQEVTIVFQDTSNQNLFNKISGQSEPALQFIEIYLEYFEFIQKILFLGQKYENKKNWKLLKYTYGLIGGYRNYHSFNQTYAITPQEEAKDNELRSRDQNDNTKIVVTDEPTAFLFVKKRLAYKFIKLIEESGKDKAKLKILDDRVVANINILLDQFLNLKVTVDKTNPYSQDITFNFESTNNANHNIEFSDLSAGQKSIIHFIFALYGYDIEKGLMVIDEPELHLHPQMQQDFLEVIRTIQNRNKLNLQFIIATHSPIFINTDVIHNVYRFSKKNSFTYIVNPSSEENEENLSRILTYTNATKIFFASKVILVEGDSDEYFYRRFFHYYKEKYTNNIQIEFLYINGKGARKLWEDFLNKFNVANYYIGDWDNLIEQKIISESELESFKLKYRTEIFKEIDTDVIINKSSNDRVRLLNELDKSISDPSILNLTSFVDLWNYLKIRHIPYKKLIEFIKKEELTYNKIKDSIINNYNNKTYILMEGELEDYLNLPSKGLSEVIDFCKNRFDSWTNDPDYQDKVQELTTIFDNIINKDI